MEEKFKTIRNEIALKVRKIGELKRLKHSFLHRVFISRLQQIEMEETIYRLETEIEAKEKYLKLLENETVEMNNRS